MLDETAWLIEAADKDGNIIYGHFLGVYGSFNGNTGVGQFCWVNRANDALRFARKQDAAMFIAAFVALSDDIAHGSTLPGLRSGDTSAIPVEHVWTDPQ